MKQRKVKLTIPHPCNQSWDAMTPSGKGKHCEHCNKCVMDFSGLSDSEIHSIIKNAKGNVCGRFENSQLEREIIVYEKSSNDLIKVAAMAAGISLFSIQANAQAPCNEVNPVVNNHPSHITMGKVAFKPKSVKRDSIHVITGKVTDATTGAILPYAVVLLANEGNPFKTITADAKGEFRMEITNLSKGEYSLVCRYAGYIKNTLILGETFRPQLAIEIKLKPDTGAPVQIHTMGIVAPVHK